MAKGKKNKASKGTKEILEMSPISLEISKSIVPDYQPRQSVSLTMDEDLLYHVADFFKVFGDATRIRILALLAEKEYCVGEIAEKLSMTQSAVSHQLRVLRQNDLVKYKKDGKTVFYSLDDDHVRGVLEQGIVHIRHKKG